MADDKFRKGSSSNTFNSAATPLDVAIDRYLETGDDAVLKTLYTPKTLETERMAALADLAKKSFPDAHSTVKAYVEAGLQLPPKIGMTARDYAPMGNNNPEMLAVLLRAGADPNAQDTVGKIDKTALDYARMGNNPEMLAVLQRAGADTNTHGTTGKTAATKPGTPGLKL